MNEIELTLNGRRTTLSVAADATLLDILRDTCGLPGTKEGCIEGECGACTVLIDGLPVDSCIYAAAACADRSVTTIEGLGRHGALTSVQEAMVAAGGVQCGFCTPGFVMTLTALLERVSSPTESQIREALSGNICRCTGYSQIAEAALEAARAATKNEEVAS